jgi:hypothetical protein
LLDHSFPQNGLEASPHSCPDGMWISHFCTAGSQAAPTYSSLRRLCERRANRMAGGIFRTSLTASPHTPHSYYYYFLVLLSLSSSLTRQGQRNAFLPNELDGVLSRPFLFTTGPGFPILNGRPKSNRCRPRSGGTIWVRTGFRQPRHPKRGRAFGGRQRRHDSSAQGRTRVVTEHGEGE